MTSACIASSRLSRYHRIAWFVSGLVALAMHPCRAIDIDLWHALNGVAGDRLVELVAKFNGSQSEVRVLPQYKGNPGDTLASALAAVKGGEQPDLVQADESMTATLMADRTRIRPLYEVLAEGHEQLDVRALLPGMASYYSESVGKLAALPFNQSTALLYYNKDAFRAAGLDPAVPPRKWRDIQSMTLALQKANASACGYASDWQAWVHVENLGAWHDEPFATRSNGMDGPDARLTFNTTFMLRHVSLLSAWAHSGLFNYYGPGNQAESHFISGECSIFTGSSGSLGAIDERARFDYAIAPIPYYDEYDGAPFRSVIGGGALWVMRGKPKAHYAAAAHFLAWLAKPEQQAAWHQATGFLPLSRSAYELTRKQGFYAQHPGYQIAIEELIGKSNNANGRGVRLLSLEKIRAVIDEELEHVWAHGKAPKDALDSAVARGNQLLQQLVASKR